jgi:single-strand DNA-binding protein
MLGSARVVEGEVETMADLNKVFLMGRLTFDPELRRTPSGSAVTELRMATTRSWLGRDNERREETLFIDVTVWDRQAETCCQFLRKGSSVHVEGSLRMDTWEDKNTGEKRSKVKVQAERVQFLDARRSDGSGGSGGMGADDEMGPPARDAGARRASAAPMRGPSGGYGEPRGPVNGPVRSSYPPAGPSEPSPVEDERAEDDIPF